MSDAIEEMGRYVHVPPRSSRKVLIVDPQRIVDLETKAERLRVERDMAWSENEQLREACMSTLECIRAGAEPWMLSELEAQVEIALERAP